MKPRGMMVIHQFRPVTGGAELQAERLAIKLAERGHGMQVFTELRTPDTMPEENINGVQVHRVGFKMAYWPCTVPHTNDTFKYLFSNRHTFDILHAHQAFGHAVVAVVVAKLTGKKSIVKVACSGEVGDLHVLSGFKLAKPALQILKNADCMIAISEEVQQELIEYGFKPSKIARIPNGVDTGAFKRDKGFPPLNEFHFVLIGRKTHQKGIDTALKAVKILKANGTMSFKLSFYGREDPKYDYQTMARELGVSELVEFCDFTDDIQEVFDNSHCLILPSRNEGMSNTLLEAMAFELPVIASAVSGTVEIVDNKINGFLIPPESPEFLAEKIQSIMQNPESAFQMGKNARKKIVENFSLEYVARKYSDLYQRL